MTEKLVTIATYADPIEANLAKIKLASEDIDCFLADENAVAVYWLAAGAMGGIKLQVKEADASKAAEILSSKKIVTEDEKDNVAIDEPAIPNCPQCGSDDVQYEKFSRKMVFLSILLIRMPVTYPKDSYKCRTCGHSWKQKEEPAE